MTDLLCPKCGGPAVRLLDSGELHCANQCDETDGARAARSHERSSAMNYVTYFDRSRPWWFTVLIATGPGTKPTPDGGPWAIEYTVTTDELEERSRLAKVSENAEELLRRMLRDHAPTVLRDAIALGWFEASPSGSEAGR